MTLRTLIGWLALTNASACVVSFADYTVGSTGAGGGDAPGYRDVVLSDGPVGYWRLGEDAGEQKAVDHSPSRMNGTYSGGVELGVQGGIAGDSDTAARFDGIDDKVFFGDVFGFEEDLPFSVEAWIAPDPKRNDPFGTVASKQEDFIDGWQFGVTALEPPMKAFFNRETAVALPPVRAVLPTEDFIHVVATFDRETMRLYLNGVPANEEPSPVPLPVTTAYLLVGGSRIDNEHFAGVIDEVALYDKALERDRIVAHHDAGTTP